jgi:hypothetical protein
MPQSNSTQPLYTFLLTHARKSICELVRNSCFSVEGSYVSVASQVSVLAIADDVHGQQCQKGMNVGSYYLLRSHIHKKFNCQLWEGGWTRYLSITKNQRHTIIHCESHGRIGNWHVHNRLF